MFRRERGDKESQRGIERNIEGERERYIRIQRREKRYWEIVRELEKETDKERERDIGRASQRRRESEGGNLRKKWSEKQG